MVLCVTVDEVDESEAALLLVGLVVVADGAPPDALRCLDAGQLTRKVLSVGSFQSLDPLAPTKAEVAQILAVVFRVVAP